MPASLRQFSFFFRRRAFFFRFLFRAGVILTRTSMLPLSIYSKRRTAQSALHKAATQLRANQSAATQAGREIWRGPACRRAFTQLAVFSKTNEEIELCPVCESCRACRRAFTQLAVFSKRTRRNRNMPGLEKLFTRSMELLAFNFQVSLVAPNRVDLSVRFIRILFSCL